LGLRAVRLATDSPKRATSTVTDPAGAEVRFVVDTERDLDDRDGTGRVLAWVERGGVRTAIAPRVSFAFGTGEAKVVGVARWGRFTWTRTPGLFAVFAGFGIILAGCTLLAFPAGVARIGRPGEDMAATLFTVRGAEAVAAEWAGWQLTGRQG
jgi:hypothetical protein